MRARSGSAGVDLLETLDEAVPAMAQVVLARVVGAVAQPDLERRGVHAWPRSRQHSMMAATALARTSAEGWQSEPSM